MYFGVGYFVGLFFVGEWLLWYDEYCCFGRKECLGVEVIGGFKMMFIVGLFIYGMGIIMFWFGVVLIVYGGFMVSFFVVGFGLVVFEIVVNFFLILCGFLVYGDLRFFFV